MSDREIEYGAYCTYSYCERRRYSHGYCISHFRRWKSGKDMDEPIRGWGNHQGINYRKKCKITLCNNKAWSRGMCHPHYNKWRTKHPDWNKPLKKRRKNTGIIGRVRVLAVTADFIKQFAKERSMTPYGVMTDVLDRWVESEILKRKLEADRDVKADGWQRSQYDPREDL